MKVIALSNRKGGVGKSTMSTHIAAGLAIQGWRVALVDTDPQGHSGRMLGQPKEDGLYKVMIEKVPMEQVVRLIAPETYSPADHPATGTLYLLPSSELTHRVPKLMEEYETFLFFDTLEAMGSLYNLDAVVIDTNPTLTLFDGSIYLATDAFIYVTECEDLSFDGVQAAIEQVQNFAKIRRRYSGRESRIIGIIPNKVRAGTYVHRHNLAELTNAYKELVWPPVTLRTIWTEITNARELIYTYAPSGQEAVDAWDKVERTRKAIETWVAEETR